MNLISSFKSLYRDNKGNQEELITDSGEHLIVYHEKQEKEMCALHALNNLFQEKAYTKAILDSLCVDMSPEEFINPHRSIFGRGNYNINVVMKALQLKKYEAIWFDKRKSATTLNLKNIKGFILNVPSDYKIAGVFSLPWERKHWYAVAKVTENEIYYDLDSKSDKIKPIGSEEKLLSYLDKLLKSKENELFVVVTKEVQETESWKNQIIEST